MKSRCLFHLTAAFICLLFLTGCNVLQTHEKGNNTGAWTQKPFKDNPDNFQFAVVADRTGKMRPGVFEGAVSKLNLLQPEFVVSIGDLTKGYTHDAEIINSEYDEMDQILEGLEMRFFRLAGNHDISNELMLNIYQQRYGRPWYHFTYKDVLFLMLYTEDTDDHISVTQAEYFVNILKDNQNVRWTFVFVHRPVFVKDRKDTSRNWRLIEKELKARPHTVFAGHWHRYINWEKYGQNCINVATTGGGSDLGGMEKGEFDHLVWITMTEKGPVIANLMLDGIYDRDLNSKKQ